ncbi:MAG: hypothetical protein ABSH38_17325 [Verrucomicrobiota bacterium]|jgi:hypothetical protein
MKSLLFVGGVLGFGIGASVSFLHADSWPTCLWHGSLAAYVTAMLMRWWGQAWRRNLEQALLERENTPSPLLPTSTPPKAKT